VTFSLSLSLSLSLIGIIDIQPISVYVQSIPIPFPTKEKEKEKKRTFTRASPYVYTSTLDSHFCQCVFPGPADPGLKHLFIRKNKMAKLGQK